MAYDLNGMRSNLADWLAGCPVLSVLLGVLMHKSTLKRIEREEAIRKVAGTMPTWQVAEIFNITEKKLQHLCGRAGISLAFYYSRYTPEDRDFIVKSRAEGMLISEIAKKLGRSEGSISSLLSNIKKQNGKQGGDHA